MAVDAEVSILKSQDGRIFAKISCLLLLRQDIPQYSKSANKKTHEI
jgi:hypothetical protein